jgi:hypothetical protein
MTMKQTQRAPSWIWSTVGAAVLVVLLNGVMEWHGTSPSFRTSMSSRTRVLFEKDSMYYQDSTSVDNNNDASRDAVCRK